MTITPARFWRAVRFAAAMGWGVGWATVGAAAEAAPVPVAANPRYTGAMAIREWSAEEIGGATQCFSIVQAAGTGLIYVGGGQGVIEYDGVRWRPLPLFPGLPVQAVRGLAVDGHGRIWAGLNNGVLRYSADAAGRWQAESVLPRLPVEAREMGTVWQLHAVGGSVWGAATKWVFRFEADGETARAWRTPDDWQIVGVADGMVWLRRPDGVLVCGQGDSLEPAALPALPERTSVLAIYRTAAGALRVDHTRGVLEREENRWRSVSADLEQMLQGENAASRVRRLADGRGVFSTRSRALVFVAPDGRVLGRFDEPAGVTFGVTPQTYVDRDGGLWMANAAGIRRVQVDGVVARHDRALGLRGDVRDLAHDGTTLFAGTAQGLFRRDPPTGRFELRSRNLSDLFALEPSPAGGWLIGAGGNFREWTEKNDVQLPGAPGGGVALAIDPRDPARVFVGGINEVRVFRRGAESWANEATLGGFGATIYSVATDDAGMLWLAGGIVPGLWSAAAVGSDWTTAKLQRRDGQDGLSEIVSSLARVDGEVAIYGRKGIWRAGPAQSQLERDARFAGLPEGAATAVGLIREGARPGVVYVAGSRGYEGRYWRGTRREKNEAWQFTELPVGEAAGQLSATDLCESPDGGTLWIGGLKGVVSLDLTAPPPPKFPVPAAQWRGVRALEGEEIFYRGAVPKTELALPLGPRAVEVEFSAPVYRAHIGGESGVEYRTRAAGVDRDWSVWSKVAARELTNLPNGRVKLEVQARNHLGAEGPVAALVLAVPPFWWETWWWRMLVVLAGAGAVAAVVRWIVRRQFRQRIALLEAQAAVQTERLRIARDMHDDLGSTLASIVHLSGGAAGAGETENSVLGRIHAATRDLVQRTRDIVWAATPQHDSLESLIEQLAAHAERTLGDRGVEVRAELPVHIPEEPIAAAARHGLFLAFKEAVNNAAKYAQARTAVVRAELIADALVVTLKDDGVGFADGEVKGTGNGLGNVRARLAALGGSAEIASVVGRGTTVTLRLPRARKRGGT